MARRAVREVDCSGPGIRRVGAGKGFYFRDPAGGRIDDPEVLDRIASLAIPPAWTDVWVCPDPAGHIQATGVDDRGRRQYLYHEEWQRRRNEEKFDRVLRFAGRLPDLRDRVAKDLTVDGVPRERALATAVRLIDIGAMRVGGESYANENGSYGVATMLKRHVRITDGVARFDFVAKSGIRRRFEVTDHDVVDSLSRMKRRRAPADTDLLAYQADGRWVDVRSEDINAYIHEAIGDEFSAKDFRTWAGTVVAAVALAERDSPESERERRKALVAAGEAAAAHLGNTAAVARSAYIDPRVIERFDDEDTLPDLDGAKLERIEQAVAELISRAQRPG